MCEKMIFLKNIKNQHYACTVSKDELKRMSEAGERSLFRAKKNVADRLREPKTMSRTLRTESCCYQIYFASAYSMIILYSYLRLIQGRKWLESLSFLRS